MNFVNRQGENLNRKRLRIISQTANEIIADIERADTPSVEGTPINATTMNQFQQEIDTANSTASSAVSTANSAVSTANTALSTANTASQNATSAVSTANTASQNATEAVSTANAANAKALYVESQLADRGATVKVNGVSQAEINFSSDPQTQLNAKLNTTAQAADSAKLGGKTESQLSVNYAASSGACSSSVNLTGDQSISGVKTFSGTVNATILKYASRTAESIVSSSFGSNGYIKYSSGLIIQWVQVKGSNEQTINLPTSFSSASSYRLGQCIICGSSGATSGVSYRNHAYSKTASSFKCYASNTADGGFEYIAIGY